MDPDDQDMPAILAWYDNTSNSLLMQDVQMGDNLPSLTITPVKTESRQKSRQSLSQTWSTLSLWTSIQGISS
jgi:hypothetical protein